MDEDQKKEFIAAFEAYKEAHRKLSEQWSKYNGDGSFNRLYPFKPSFDELYFDVALWVDDSINFLNLEK